MEDIQYHFLLQSDINDIPRVCHTNRILYRHCSNKQFWINKFEQDRLPFLNDDCQTISCWIDEYNITEYAVDKTVSILNKLKIQTLPFFKINLTGFDELITSDILLNILPITFVNKYKDSIQNIYDHINDNQSLSIGVSLRNNVYTLTFNMYDFNTNQSKYIKEQCHKNDIQHILIILLHEYPNIEILDNKNDNYV